MQLISEFLIEIHKMTLKKKTYVAVQDKYLEIVLLSLANCDPNLDLSLIQYRMGHSAENNH